MVGTYGAPSPGTRGTRVLRIPSFLWVLPVLKSGTAAGARCESVQARTRFAVVPTLGSRLVTGQQTPTVPPALARHQPIVRKANGSANRYVPRFPTSGRAPFSHAAAGGRAEERAARTPKSVIARDRSICSGSYLNGRGLRSASAASIGSRAVAWAHAGLCSVQRGA
jgi:hypothetical protein